MEIKASANASLYGIASEKPFDSSGIMMTRQMKRQRSFAPTLTRNFPSNEKAIHATGPSWAVLRSHPSDDMSISHGKGDRFIFPKSSPNAAHIPRKSQRRTVHLQSGK